MALKKNFSKNSYPIDWTLSPGPGMIGIYSKRLFLLGLRYETVLFLDQICKQKIGNQGGGDTEGGIDQIDQTRAEAGQIGIDIKIDIKFTYNHNCS